MKNNYSWETDDESDWEPSSTPEVSSPRVGSRALLLPAAGVIVACLLILFLLDRRLEGREDIIRQNIVAAQRTWEQSVDRQDLELFSTLISRAQADWYQSQRRLLMSGRTLDRRSFGLELLPGEPDQFDIDLDASWRKAELAFPRRYTVSGTDDRPPITLFQTLTYQISGDRWQLAPPSASFWGNSVIEDIGLVNITYPERDKEFISRLASDLAHDLADICAEYPTARECLPDSQILIEFETSPESLLALEDVNTLALSGRTIVLPAPSLVGLPADEAAYDALYQGYTERIREMLRNDLALPAPLPEQDIALLCFPTPDQGATLYTYAPAADQWAEQAESKRFSFIQALPDDSGLVLRVGLPGTYIAHLELVLQREGGELVLVKEGTTELSARLNAMPSRSQSESLILSTVHGSTGITDYRLLSLESCADTACDVEPLAGFPIWSPDGERTLILVGSQLHIGDSEGNPQELIGRAFSPFWLTDDTFGFVRLLGDSTAESSEMELVLRSVVSGKERLLAKSTDLLRQLGSADTGGFRIMYVTTNPENPNRLFLAGTPVGGGRKQFFVLEIQLGDSPDLALMNNQILGVEAIVVLDGLPVGDSSTLTPTGYPPFRLSPDGRWLMVVRFADPITNTWALYLHNVEDGETKTITFNYPTYPSPFPFYDWSADGNWLLLVDNGFLRLIAPDHDYERIITHDFVACRYPAWVNRSVLAAGVE